MQFLVVGHDGTDEQASARRMAARPAHIALGDKMVRQGTMLFGVALLSEEREPRMVGSVLVVDFGSRQELDEWLTIEPYVTGKVWERIEVTACRVGPSFASGLER